MNRMVKKKILKDFAIVKLSYLDIRQCNRFFIEYAQRIRSALRVCVNSSRKLDI